MQEYEEEGRRSRRHSSPCNSREGSTTALHTQHYDEAVSNRFCITTFKIYIKKNLFSDGDGRNITRFKVYLNKRKKILKLNKDSNKKYLKLFLYYLSID